MSLIKCNECATEISDKAMLCPKCGAKLRKAKRTFFGKLVKYSFIAFNLFMLYSMITGLGTATQTAQSYSSEAEQAGAAIGTGLGIMVLLFIWGIGDFILGLFVFLTRAK